MKSFRSHGKETHKLRSILVHPQDESRAEYIADSQIETAKNHCISFICSAISVLSVPVVRDASCPVCVVNYSKNIMKHFMEESIGWFQIP